MNNKLVCAITSSLRILGIQLNQLAYFTDIESNKIFVK